MNADADDNFTWKSVDANKVEIDMHDEDVAGSVIAEFSVDDGVKRIVLTSNDLNWQTESLKEISSNMSQDEFLKSIHDQYSEGHGPNISNE